MILELNDARRKEHKRRRLCPLLKFDHPISVLVLEDVKGRRLLEEARIVEERSPG
jgi:hypothetical protein